MGTLCLAMGLCLHGRGFQCHGSHYTAPVRVAHPSGTAINLISRYTLRSQWLVDRADLAKLGIMPRSGTSDYERKRRFVQEARTASALNHPNIVTIHEIAIAGSLAGQLRPVT